MYKIPNEVIHFIEKTMKAWKVKLAAGGKSLTVVKIQRGIFLGDALSPFSVNNSNDATQSHSQKMHRYKLSRSQEKINHLKYMDDIKLFAKN